MSASLWKCCLPVNVGYKCYIKYLFKDPEQCEQPHVVVRGTYRWAHIMELFCETGTFLQRSFCKRLSWSVREEIWPCSTWLMVVAFQVLMAGLHGLFLLPDFSLHQVRDKLFRGFLSFLEEMTHPRCLESPWSPPDSPESPPHRCWSPSLLSFLSQSKDRRQKARRVVFVASVCEAVCLSPYSWYDSLIQTSSFC